jgi:hypothetical protein
VISHELTRGAPSNDRSKAGDALPANSHVLLRTQAHVCSGERTCGMVALAGDFYILFSGAATRVAAVALPLRNIAKAGYMFALPCFLSLHVSWSPFFVICSSANSKSSRVVSKLDSETESKISRMILVLTF